MCFIFTSTLGPWSFIWSCCDPVVIIQRCSQLRSHSSVRMPNRCYRSTWPFGLMMTVGCRACLPKPETPCDNKTRDMVMGSGSSKPHKMQSSHIKVSSSSPQALFSTVETPRPVCRHDHATHLCPSLSLWPQPSSSIPPTHLHATGGCSCMLNVCQPYVLSRSRLLSVH